MDLVEIAPHVHACLQPDRGLGWSNSGLVDRGGGLVVDTFWDLPHTRQAMQLYAEVTYAVPGRVVNTHHNGDHCWGNQLYAEVGSEIIGHRLCAEQMAADTTPALLRGLAEADPAELGPPLAGFAEALAEWDFRDVVITPPTTLLDEELELDLDGTLARVLYVGPAHTAGDVVVHLPAEGVVFAGDVLFHRCTPIGWEGTTERWVAALDRVVALEPAVVVPGHGPLADIDGVRAMREYLLYVFEEARSGHDAGLSPLDCAKQIDLGPPYLGWTEPERLAFNVHRAYRELRGEPWDTPVDLMTVLGDVAQLRDHLAGSG